jgi:YD repeat-containing protein
MDRYNNQGWVVGLTTWPGPDDDPIVEERTYNERGFRTGSRVTGGVVNVAAEPDADALAVPTPSACLRPQLPVQVVERALAALQNEADASARDVLGRVTSVGSGKQQLTLDYDGTNRLLAVTHGSKTFLSLKYSPTGRLLEASDRRGRVAAFTYDGVGQMLTARFWRGAEARYNYDGDRNQAYGALLAEGAQIESMQYFVDGARRTRRTVWSPLGDAAGTEYVTDYAYRGYGSTGTRVRAVTRNSFVNAR